MIQLIDKTANLLIEVKTEKSVTDFEKERKSDIWTSYEKIFFVFCHSYVKICQKDLNFFYCYSLFKNTISFIKKNIRHNSEHLTQVFTYMIRNGNKYGMLTCNVQSWFFVIEPEYVNGKLTAILYISKAVDQEKLLQELFKFVCLAMEDPRLDKDLKSLYCAKPSVTGDVIGDEHFQNYQVKCET